MAKPKRILVLVSVFTRQSSVLQPDDYKDFFSKSLEGVPDVQLDVAPITDVVFAVQDNVVHVLNGTTGQPLNEYDLIILRGSMIPIIDLANCIGLYCRQENIECWNQYATYVSRSKLAQTVQFAYLGAPVPDSVFSYNQTLLTKYAAEILGYPLIAKDWFGTKGNDNYLVKDELDFSAILSQIDTDKIQLIAQEYIENDGDVRVLIVGDSTLLIGRKATDGSHLNNTSQGAEASLLEPKDLGQPALDWSTKIAKAFDCTIAGVDVIFDRKRNPYFLEINTQPQIVTGAYMDEKIAMTRSALLKALDREQE